MTSNFDSLLNEFLSEREIENAKIKGDFTAKLIKARRDRGLTQSELATKAKIKQSALARIENEGSMPRLDTIYRLLGALDSEMIVDVADYKNEHSSDFINNNLIELVEIINRLNRKVDGMQKTINCLSSKLTSLETEYKKKPKVRFDGVGLNKDDAYLNLLKMSGMTSVRVVKDSKNEWSGLYEY